MMQINRNIATDNVMPPFTNGMKTSSGLGPGVSNTGPATQSVAVNGGLNFSQHTTSLSQ